MHIKKGPRLPTDSAKKTLLSSVSQFVESVWQSQSNQSNPNRQSKMKFIAAASFFSVVASAAAAADTPGLRRRELSDSKTFVSLF